MAQQADERTPRLVLLLGGPGAGKGTQASLLAPRLSIPHISSGELLRGARGVDPRMRAGELLPDEVATRAVLDRLAQPDAAQGAILDGFPRTPAQAEALDRWLAERGGTLDAVIHLEVPRDTMVQRVADRGQVSQRSDDRTDVADRRAALFAEELPALLAHYQRRGPVHRIDGTQPIDEVQRQIGAVLSHRPPPGR
jgi:adenylate kinase